ncbi:MAG: peptide-methionine (S)-S-oxide reductase [Arhodomonas sp.]|nr:peptide-methionine (S)-S-oxide reductase [Arhodomonas sp.]
MRNIVAVLALFAALGLAVLPLFAGGASDRQDRSAEDSALEVATFAGGCFWCVEAGFEKLPGVAEAVSGYSGGELANPSYEQVSAGRTGHTETVQAALRPRGNQLRRARTGVVAHDGSDR